MSEFLSALPFRHLRITPQAIQAGADLFTLSEQRQETLPMRSRVIT